MCVFLTFSIIVISLQGSASKPSIAREMEKIMQDKGVEEAISQYKYLKKNFPKKYNFKVDELHNLGRKLFNQKKREEAVRILELNAEVYPQVPKVHNILAQVYFYTGRRKQSKDSFNRYLDMTPESRLRDVIFRKKLYFVPDDFDVPLVLETERFRIRPLTSEDAEFDYKAVMSSVDHLKGVLGHKWPDADMTLEENRRSLEGHEREFELRMGFTYTVVNLDETECLGCVYIRPSRLDDHDTEVLMWVTKAEFDKGLDSKLFEAVNLWMKREWPFEKIIFPGREIAWSDFFEKLEEQDKKYK